MEWDFESRWQSEFVSLSSRPSLPTRKLKKGHHSYQAMYLSPIPASVPVQLVFVHSVKEGDQTNTEPPEALV